MSKFLLLLGPSGVGKSTIIEELIRIDERFTYISPYMTRGLRDGEKNKIPIGNEEMNILWNKGELLVINTLYDDIRYATPRVPIIKALKENRFPVLDWPISRVEIMTESFLDQLYLVYVAPVSIDVLKNRLNIDNRDINGKRFESACSELQAYWSHEYDSIFNLAIVSEENQIAEIAHTIYINYLSSFSP